MTETGHFTDRDGPVSGVDAHAAAGTSWTGPETLSRLRASDRRAPSLQAGADGARSLHEPLQRRRAEAVPVPGQTDQPRGEAVVLDLARRDGPAAVSVSPASVNDVPGLASPSPAAGGGTA